MFSRLRERVQFAAFCILHRRSLAAQLKWQGRHLRRLVVHASRNVPMWRSLLSSHSVDVESIWSLDDIGMIPVTSKKTYLGKMAEEYTDSSSPALSYWYVTSGTSGMPFTFLMGDHARQSKYIDFASLRFLWWRGETIQRISTINFARIKIQAQSSRHRFFLSVPEYLKDPIGALGKIAEFKPEILGTYPSLLLDIARLVREHPRLKNPELKYALSFGETLAPSIRKEVENSLGCEIYNRYGLEEIGAVGVECKLHDGFHINTESVIIEILDKDGAALPSGEDGRIVATDLFNYAMPFIRYDSGDFGRIAYEKCSCGLASPRLWVKGRHSAYLTFPSRRIHHLEFDAAMDTFMNYVYQYQIAKLSDTAVLARIIPGPSFHKGVITTIRENLGQLLGPDIEIDVAEVKELPVTERGKSRIVIDESGETRAV